MLTNKQEEFLLALRESNGIISHAAKRTKLARNMIYLWKEQSPDFRAELEDIKSETLDFAENCLLDAMKGGNITAIIFYLKSQGRERGWQETNNVTAEYKALQELLQTAPAEAIEKIARRLLELQQQQPEIHNEQRANKEKFIKRSASEVREN